MDNNQPFLFPDSQIEKHICFLYVSLIYYLIRVIGIGTIYYAAIEIQHIPYTGQYGRMGHLF